MKERIQELIRQSAVPANQAESYALSKGLIEPTEKLDVAKFAELIVRECAGICDNDYVRCGQDGAGWKLAREIEEHFGVEECLKND